MKALGSGYLKKYFAYNDVLADHALEWLKNREQDKPFLLYLSNKAIHAEFMPAKRHKVNI